jgi:hypothetical protein
MPEKVVYEREVKALHESEIDGAISYRKSFAIKGRPTR